MSLCGTRLGIFDRAKLDQFLILFLFCCCFLFYFFSELIFHSPCLSPSSFLYIWFSPHMYFFLFVCAQFASIDMPEKFVIICIASMWCLTQVGQLLYRSKDSHIHIHKHTTHLHCAFIINIHWAIKIMRTQPYIKCLINEKKTKTSFILLQSCKHAKQNVVIFSKKKFNSCTHHIQSQNCNIHSVYFFPNIYWKRIVIFLWNHFDSNLVANETIMVTSDDVDDNNSENDSHSGKNDDSSNG